MYKIKQMCVILVFEINLGNILLNITLFSSFISHPYYQFMRKLLLLSAEKIYIKPLEYQIIKNKYTVNL